MNIVTRGYGTCQLIVTRGYGICVAIPAVWPCRNIISYLERKVDMMIATEHLLLAKCVLEIGYKPRVVFEEEFSGLARLEEKFKIWVRWCK